MEKLSVAVKIAAANPAFYKNFYTGYSLISRSL